MTPFDKAFKDVIDVEGGFSNHVDDRGGRTRFGITEWTARANGYTGDMRELPLGTAKKIYKAQYWDIMRLDDVAKLDYPIAHELFDTGVNMGIGKAGEFLQRALNALNDQQQHYRDVVVDNIVGPMTLGALTAYLALRGADGKVVMLRALNSLQGARYVELAEGRERNETFVYGWFRTRVV